MRKIFILLFSFFMLSKSALAQNDRMGLLEEEVQKLTNKIELLEHEINLIKTHSPQTSQPNLEQIAKTESSPAPSVSANVPLDKQKYDLALGKLKDKKYEESKEEFADFLESYPKSSMLDRALFWYAESYFGQKDFQNAALNYLKCYQKFPKGQKAQDSLLKLATSLGELKRKAEVCKIIAKLETEFPNRSASVKKTANDLKVKHNCKR